jgi:hypothetical protein
MEATLLRCALGIDSTMLRAREDAPSTLPASPRAEAVSVAAFLTVRRRVGVFLVFVVFVGFVVIESSWAGDVFLGSS